LLTILDQHDARKRTFVWRLPVARHLRLPPDQMCYHPRKYGTLPAKDGIHIGIFISPFWDLLDRTPGANGSDAAVECFAHYRFTRSHFKIVLSWLLALGLKEPENAGDFAPASKRTAS
jgi:hypothetical protein